jgi:hypothetical protein
MWHANMVLLFAGKAKGQAGALLYVCNSAMCGWAPQVCLCVYVCVLAKGPHQDCRVLHVHPPKSAMNGRTFLSGGDAETLWLTWE